VAGGIARSYGTTREFDRRRAPQSPAFAKQFSSFAFGVTRSAFGLARPRLNVIQGNPETPDFPDPYCVKPKTLIRGWRMKIAAQQSRDGDRDMGL
jgi:hypothetical protein